MYIIGAGLAGLLAGNILRHYNPTILEAQPSLPNNHKSVLRHRDNRISEATSIPFKKVRVTKGINYKGEIYTQPQIRFSNMYSYKVTGRYMSRSIDNLDTVARYIAPPNFIQQLARGLDIEYGVRRSSIGPASLGDVPIISTIPMPELWNLINPAPLAEARSKIEFQSINIHTVVSYILGPEVDLYQTFYYPNRAMGLYRISITGNKVMAEFTRMDWRDRDMMQAHNLDYDDLYGLLLHFLEHDFGLTNIIMSRPDVYDTKYGKISPIDNVIRKQFIHHCTSQYAVFSLGRYATWRNILLDDVYDDIIAIQKLLNQQGFYPST